MAQQKDTGAMIKTGVEIALAIAGIIAIKKVMEMFGLIKTAEEKRVDKATADANQSADTGNNPMLSFNGNYAVTLIKDFIKRNPREKWFNNWQLQFSNADYVDMAKNIKDSYGYFNDDEEKLYSVFRRINTQYQLAILSSLFYALYKKDMLEYMKSFMNANEMQPIIDIVSNYPKYKPNK
jgi:hypothetical protein